MRIAGLHSPPHSSGSSSRHTGPRGACSEGSRSDAGASAGKACRSPACDRQAIRGSSAHRRWSSRFPGQLDQRDHHAARAPAAEHAAGADRRGGAARREKDARRRSRSARGAERSEPRRAAGWRRSAQEPERGADLSRALWRAAAERSAATTRSGSIPATACLRVDGQPRSSIIIDPPNGRVPGYTDEARAGMAKAAEIRKTQGSEFDHPELRPLAERCITSFGNNAGPPMLPNYFYNNSYTIVQSKDTVMILTEMVHDARIVRMNGTHPPAGTRKWFGDSIGRWEGDTLVIETTNFHPESRLPRLVGEPEGHRADFAQGRENHQLPVHRRGSRRPLRRRSRASWCSTRWRREKWSTSTRAMKPTTVSKG